MSEGSPEYRNLVERVIRSLQGDGEAIVINERREFQITPEDVEVTADMLNEGEGSE